MEKLTTIRAPKVYPGTVCYARNYRSKPYEPWVLVKVKYVKTGWNSDGTITKHAYDCIRLNSTDPDDYMKGSYKGRKGEGGTIFLYVNDDSIMTL